MHMDLCTTKFGACASDFTGKERDSESGLDNFGARHYSSSLGRFMSPDIIGGDASNPQSLNRYSYVLNNPLNLIDALGLQAGCVVSMVGSDGTNFGGNCPGGSDVGSLPTGTADNLVPLTPSPSQSGASAGDLPDSASGISSANAGAGSAGSNPGLDATQLGLGALTLWPGPVGTGASLANAGISFYRGNYGQGALDLAFAIPFVGTFGKIGEFGEEGFQTFRAFKGVYGAAGEGCSGITSSNKP